MPANLESLAVAKELEKLVFTPILKKSSAKECSYYHTIALISHASKVILKILQAKLQQYMNWELPMFNLDLKKAEEPDQITYIHWIIGKAREFQKKTSVSASLTMPKPLTVWITKNWKILPEMGIPDHLICLLRNLYAGQEATVRTGHGTIDWFQIGKGVYQGYILSPCLFNLYVSFTSCKMPGWMKHKL